MAVDSTGGNTPVNNQFSIKPLSTDQNGKVDTAQSKQTINIFSSYDTDKNEVINSSDTKNISIFDQKKQALESRMNAFTLSDNLKGKQINGKDIEDLKNQTIKNKLSDFQTMATNFTFKVGKITQQIFVKEGSEVDQTKLQTERTGTMQLDNKVETAAMQKANDTMTKLEQAYKEALDSLASQVKTDQEDNVNNENKTDALSDHNSETTDDSKVTKTEVYSDYDGNQDKHVKYSEVDGKATFQFNETNFGIDTGTEWGQFIDKSSNYDVKAKFDQYAQKFDAKVGSIKVNGNDTKEDITNKIQQAKSDLNTKATNMAERFNEEITQKVKTEKFNAINNAIKADKNGAKFDAFKQEQLQEDIKEITNMGAVPDSEFKGEVTNLPQNHQSIRTDTENYKPSGSLIAEQIVSNLLDSLFTNLFDVGGIATGYDSQEVREGKEADTFDAKKFKDYQKHGISPAVARFMADSENGVTPAAYDAKGNITKVTVKNSDGQTVTMKLDALEEFIKEQKNKTTIA